MGSLARLEKILIFCSPISPIYPISPISLRLPYLPVSTDNFENPGTITTSTGGNCSKKTLHLRLQLIMRKATIDLSRIA